MENSSTFLLETVEKIYKVSEKCENSTEYILLTINECKVIADFYSCEEGLEALILAVLIHQSVIDKAITNNSISKILHIPFIDMGLMVRTIWKLSRRKLVRSIRDREIGIKYKLYPIVFQSTYYGEKFEEIETKEGPTFKFISTIRSESLRLFNDEITTSELLIFSKDIMQEAKDLPFIQWLKTLNLSNWDILVFLNSCYEHVVSSKQISIDLILNLVFDTLYDRFEYKKSFADGTNSLIRKGLIEWQYANIQSATEYILSEKTINVLILNDLTPIKNEITSKYFKIITPQEINTEILLYNEKEDKEIQILKNALRAENYCVLLEKLAEQNFNKGLNILFYGCPGTGKTSTAYQIAKESQRVLLYTDASALKSMWLGESEKNIKKLFDDYYNICSQLDHIPILLFNEADAILSNRTKVNSSVDQTSNTIQNILLQQLESFEGIFMATTNLTNNLDPAFERRFLYKVLFEKPNNKIVDKLLEIAFPEIPISKLNKPSGRLSFTGSNIANMKKRLIIRTSFENIPVTPELINDLAFEEFYNTNNKAQVIGFIK